MFNLTSHCLAPPLEVYGAPLGGRAPQFKNHCSRWCCEAFPALHQHLYTIDSCLHFSSSVTHLSMLHRYDIYSSVVYNVADIKYEMACILYNIGALHTDLGALDARNTPDGMKISCTHFQCAAWAFQVCPLWNVTVCSLQMSMSSLYCRLGGGCE